MGSLSITHILVLVVLALIFFGPSRLPQLGQSLGKALRGFKQGLNEIEVDAKDIKDEPQQVSHQNTKASAHHQSQAQKSDTSSKT